MSETGLVSVVDERGRTLAKAIAFKGGEHASNLATIVQIMWPMSLELLYRTALCFRFGDPNSLILVDRTTVLYNGNGNLGSGKLYRLTFDNPSYCPPPFAQEENLKIVTVPTRPARNSTAPKRI